MSKNDKVSAEKDKALETAIGSIEKRFGKGSIMLLDDSSTMAVEAISTGSLSIDMALGVGGLPKGRIIEIYGPESSGKTTLALAAIAQAQKEGGRCAFIDAEHALDPSWARRLGVDTGKLLIAQPDCAEDALEICESLTSSGAMDIIVIDSVAALVPRAELEGEMGDMQVGLQARLMSKALRKLTAIVSKSKTMIIFINQIRMKIGMTGYGSPETTTGGNALKFYATVRIDIRRIGSVKKGDEAIANQVKVTVRKNKVAPPFKVALAELYFNEGFSRAADIIEFGLKLDIIEKAGTWFSVDGQRFQGKEKLREAMNLNPELMNAIETKIRASWRADLVEAGAVNDDSGEREAA